MTTPNFILESIDIIAQLRNEAMHNTNQTPPPQNKALGPGLRAHRRNPTGPTPPLNVELLDLADLEGSFIYRLSRHYLTKADTPTEVAREVRNILAHCYRQQGKQLASSNSDEIHPGLSRLVQHLAHIKLEIPHDISKEWTHVRNQTRMILNKDEAEPDWMDLKRAAKRMGISEYQILYRLKPQRLEALKSHEHSYDFFDADGNWKLAKDTHQVGFHHIDFTTTIEGTELTSSRDTGWDHGLEPSMKYKIESGILIDFKEAQLAREKKREKKRIDAKQRAAKQPRIGGQFA